MANGIIKMFGFYEVVWLCIGLKANIKRNNDFLGTVAIK
jgi:hypothetical protein